MKTLVLFILTMTFSGTAFSESGDMPCDAFVSKIESKIRNRFTKTKAKAKKTGQCDGALIGAAVQTTVARCGQLIAEADNYCKSINYASANNTDGGMGKQARDVSTELTKQMDRFDTQSMNCAEKLAQVPKQCPKLSEQLQNKLLRGGCNVQQISQTEEKSVQNAIPNIMKFCHAANFYKNAQADHFRMQNARNGSNNDTVSPTQGHNN